MALAVAQREEIQSNLSFVTEEVHPYTHSRTRILIYLLNPQSLYVCVCVCKEVKAYAILHPFPYPYTHILIYPYTHIPIYSYTHILIYPYTHILIYLLNPYPYNLYAIY
jgi:hypothetical protein